MGLIKVPEAMLNLTNLQDESLKKKHSIKRENWGSEKKKNIKRKKRKKKKKNYSTLPSRLVSDVSTTKACWGLRSQSGRDARWPPEYDRSRKLLPLFRFRCKFFHIEHRLRRRRRRNYFVLSFSTSLPRFRPRSLSVTPPLSFPNHLRYGD